MTDDLKILVNLYERMLKIRITEETITEKYSEWEMRCPSHLSIGQEAIASGVCGNLTNKDFVLSTHRSHAHYIAKGGDMNGMIAEIYGKSTGCSAGKGGSMHLIDKTVGFMGSTAIVGNTIPLAVGLALSIQLKGTNNISCVFFGDGAGAVVVKPSGEQGIIDCQLGADGQYKDLLWYPAGPSKDFQNISNGNVNLEMNGSEVFKVAVRTLGNVAEETLQANNIDKSELNWLVPHQANLRIIQATAKRLDLPMDKVILTVQDHGNTSSASIPMALDVGIKDERIKRNQLILMEAFGGGFTWGTVLMRY